MKEISFERIVDLIGHGFPALPVVDDVVVKDSLTRLFSKVCRRKKKKNFFN